MNLGLAPGEDREGIPDPELIANKPDGPELISRPEADRLALEIEALARELEVAAAEQDQHE